MLGDSVGGMGLATAGAMFMLGRSSTSRVREWTALHIGRRRGVDGAPGAGRSLVRPNGGPPRRVHRLLAGVSLAHATNGG